MKKGLFTVLFSLSLSFSFSQLISNSPAGISLADIPFNRQFIQKNKIKTIRANVSTKADGDTIVDRGIVRVYDFDTTGNIKRFYFTKIKTCEKKDVTGFYYGRKKRKIYYARPVFVYTYDTTFTHFFYDKFSQIIGKRFRDGDFYDTWYFEYDSLRNVTKETHCRETNAGNVPWEFVLGVQTILSEEKFTYLLQTPNQIKKKCFNDENKVYKETIINIDNGGRKLEERSSFIVGWVRTSIFYTYDTLFNLLEKKMMMSDLEEKSEKWTCEYDKKGNVLIEKYFKNDEEKNQTDYLYDEQKKFLRTKLTRHPAEKLITIVKFSYELY